MICISIAQESRRLALADMLNAARQCDLLEVRLDRFGKAPDVGELLSAKPKPVIMSCRRPRDGGLWDGSEEERLAILRQCIISKADYVEIELDVADQIRPFPPAKRVIAYTNRNETPANIAEIYAQAQTKRPDVIKLTTLARTPEEAWPLVQMLARAPVPTVRRRTRQARRHAQCARCQDSALRGPTPPWNAAWKPIPISRPSPT